MYPNMFPMFKVHKPRPDLEIPLIVVMPSIGSELPGTVPLSYAQGREAMASLAAELAEPDVRETFWPAIYEGATVITSELSRLILDRCVDLPYMAPRDVVGEFVDENGEAQIEIEMPDSVADRTPDGQPLWDDHFNEDDIDNLMATYYYPFRQAIDETVARFLDRFGRCWIIEAHSHAPEPEAGDVSEVPRALIELGYDETHVAGGMVRWFLDREKRFQKMVKAEYAPDPCGGRPLASVNAHNAGSLLPLDNTRLDPRVRSLRVSILRDIHRAVPKRGAEEPLEICYYIPFFLRRAAMDIADRMDIHRSHLSAGDAVVLLDQHLREEGYPPFWNITRVIDGDTQRPWIVTGRHSHLQAAKDVEHLRGCWVVNTSIGYGGLPIMDQMQPSYLVDKWSGAVMPTVRTDLKFESSPNRC